LVRERGPEARAPGYVGTSTRAGGPRSWVRWYVNAGRRPALLGTLVRQRGPEARAPGCVAQRGPEARATGVRWYVNAGRRPALLGYSAPMIWRGEGIRRDLAEFKGHLHRRTVGLLTWLDRRGCVPYSRTGFSHH